MEKINKIGIFVIALLILINGVNAYSCSLPGYASVNQLGPTSGSNLQVGSPNLFWDGLSTVILTSTVNMQPYSDCDSLTARQYLVTPFDYYSETWTFYTYGRTEQIDWVKTVSVPGTYRWYSYIRTGSCTGATDYCSTNEWTFTTSGASLPTAPHIDTLSPSGTFASGTTSVPLICKGSCPDSNGCNVRVRVNGLSVINQPVSSCTGINCWTMAGGYSVSDGNTYDVNCRVTDSYGQYDSWTQTFIVNGSSCPTSVNSQFVSPTPVHGSTVTNQDFEIRFKPITSPPAEATVKFYRCRDYANTCSPVFLECPAVSGESYCNPILLDGRTNVVIDDILSGEYYRWYVGYDFTDPACTDIVPRSNAGSTTAWFKRDPLREVNVTLLGPSNGAQLSNPTVTFTYDIGAVTATTLNRLWLNNNIVKSATETVGPNSYVTTLSPGFYEWEVTADDGVGFGQSQLWNFTILQGPQVNLVAPSNGGAVIGSTIELSWTVSSPYATTDRLYINGNLYQTFSPTTQFTRTFTFPLSGGTTTWYINSTDTNGLSTLSNTWSFFVNCTPAWSMQTSSCLPSNQQLVTWIDLNNCGQPVPGNLTPANGTYASCHYCSNSWECNSYGECEIGNVMPCLSVINAAAVPCANATVPSLSSYDQTCQYGGGADTIGFSSNDLVDLDDPFNKGILPDIFKGIIAFLSTPFFYWLMWICVALVIFLSAVAILVWVRNKT